MCAREMGIGGSLRRRMIEGEGGSFWTLRFRMEKYTKDFEFRSS